jgi:outer membrane protein assembly factor BamB
VWHDWRLPTAVLAVLAATLLLQGVAADFGATEPVVTGASDTPTPNNTLVGVPGRSAGGWPNGRAIELNPDGEVVWRYEPEHARVYDVEVLGETVLVAAPTMIAAENCPDEHLDYVEQRCVKNRVIEVDYDTKEIVWHYSWYDERIHNSDVHDADRLPNGNTAIADMAKERALIVAPNGTVVWEWGAANHLGANSSYHRTYGGRLPPADEDEHMKMKRDGGWLHLNDIDVLENGNVQLSLRNDDTVVEVDRETKAIVRVIGEPDNHTILHAQHNPIRLAHAGTVLVADSENDRIVEIDVDTGERVWAYGGTGRLTWPRDGKRLPNGHTLITDTRAGRVVEIDRNGTIVWEVTELGNPYSAVRIGDGENPDDAVPGRVLTGDVERNRAVGLVKQAVGLSHYVLPEWMGAVAILNLLGVVLSGGWLVGVVLWPPVCRRLGRLSAGWPR